MTGVYVINDYLVNKVLLDLFDTDYNVYLYDKEWWKLQYKIPPLAYLAASQVDDKLFRHYSSVIPPRVKQMYFSAPLLWEIIVMMNYPYRKYNDYTPMIMELKNIKNYMFNRLVNQEYYCTFDVTTYNDGKFNYILFMTPMNQQLLVNYTKKRVKKHLKYNKDDTHLQWLLHNKYSKCDRTSTTVYNNIEIDQLMD